MYKSPISMLIGKKAETLELKLFNINDWFLKECGEKVELKFAPTIFTIRPHGNLYLTLYRSICNFGSEKACGNTQIAGNIKNVCYLWRKEDGSNLQ